MNVCLGLLGRKALGMFVLALLVGGRMVWAQDAPSASQAPQSHMEAPPVQQTGAPIVRIEPESSYDKTIFLKTFPVADLAFLKQYDGAPAKDLIHDKQFKKVLKDVLPGCMFHYGKDMPLDEAVDMVMKDSRVPVRIRDGRYVVVSGLGGPYLSGRGFVWIDMQDGVALGGFYFHPTNGEPTPTLAIYSKQIKEDQVAMSELPPVFGQDMAEWQNESRVPTVTTQYFLTGKNKRVLLEHDEDYCSPADGMVAPAGDCEELNADAADADEQAAYYLDQVHYATNATAWMIGADQVAWIGVRERTCGGVVDPLGCRIRVTREHTHVIIGRGPVGHGGRR
ncbi:hypothetical protein [Granulicella tundricola]|uniref:Uncharacterized protein n=1 Tax=Granulicella tundricola (strain ATCC BAA-1859 / DSM 23138 / MP5ACTX9) TaxID=1198114 RepID=E8X2M3_GRATM|nr:hypothetical protein [Granulicella tundricola]ADW69247.1 hypothetical protein AciX9_2203 [Granulicella tundricola MP5ACTX9]